MKIVVLAAAFLTLAAALSIPVTANSPSGEVNATVSVKIIAITVSPTTLNYGVMNLNQTHKPSDPTSIDIRHTGTGTQDIWIKGSNTAAWQIADAPDADKFVHKVSKNGLNDFINLALAYKGFWPDLEAGGNVVINAFFHLDTPTSTSSTSQQTTKVTVLAVESVSSGFGTTPPN